MEQRDCAWIGPGDGRWRDALRELPHDIYHSPDYVSLAAKHEGGFPMAFLWRQQKRPFLIPLVIKALPPWLCAPAQWRDAFSPYGYASPLVPPDAAPVLVAEFLREFSLSALEQNLITAFVRLHPLLPLPRVALESAGTLIHHGLTVYADLREPPSLAWGQMREDIRRGIRKLERAGFAAFFDAWEDYAGFIAIYRETMGRVDAAAHYYFSDEYFKDLHAQLGNGLHLCSIRSPLGDIAAAGLFFTAGDIVQYHLGGTATKYLYMSPAKLLLHAVTGWAQEKGIRFFHLGGGVGGVADSLYHFKKGFSRRSSEFQTLRMVTHPEGYKWLVNRSGSLSPDAAGFFPPYRRATVFPERMTG